MPDSRDKSQAFVDGQSLGEAIITVKVRSPEGRDAQASCKVSVIPVPDKSVTGVSFRGDKILTLKLGTAVEPLKVSPTPLSPDNISRYEWISSDEDVVKVSEFATYEPKWGKLELISPGTANITVKVIDTKGNEFKDTCTIIVIE